MIYGHGNNIYEHQDKILADFSSNIWHNPIPKALNKYIKKQIKLINKYPEPDALSLKINIANLYKLHNNNVIVTNGSVEAIYLIAQTFKNMKSGIIIPTFAEYQDSCKLHNHKISHYLNSTNWTNIIFNEDLVWICNPNNPDGKYISITEIENMVKNNSSTTFIIDEAYGELCINFKTATPLISKYSNIIIIKSFTKTFAIPGLRLGFILSNNDTIQKTNNYKIPWMVNTIAINTGNYIATNFNRILPNVNQIHKESTQFKNALSTIPNITITPSQTNYFLLKLKTQHASKLKEVLVKKYKILVRDASNFEGLDNTYIRVSTQKNKSIKMLTKALTKELS